MLLFANNNIVQGKKHGIEGHILIAQFTTEQIKPFIE